MNMRNDQAGIVTERAGLPLGKLPVRAGFALRMRSVAFAVLGIAALAALPAVACESCKRDAPDHLLLAEAGAEAEEICNVMGSIAAKYIALRSNGTGMLKAVRRVVADDSLKGHESGWTPSRPEVIAFVAGIEKSGAVQSYIDQGMEDPGIVHGLYYLECMTERSAA